MNHSDNVDKFIEKLKSYAEEKANLHRKNSLSLGDAVYHYTGFMGLEGILKTKTIRLHETTYMNDRSELNNFRDACVESYTASIIGSSSMHHRDVGRAWEIEFFRNYVEECFKAPAYCASLSCHDSLLSQWRAYAPHGGVSIGFDRTKLMELAAKAGFKSSWCVYDKMQAKYPDRGTFRTSSPGNLEDPLGLIWREAFENLPQDNSATSDLFTDLARYTAVEAQRGPQNYDYAQTAIPRMKSAAMFFFKVAPIFKNHSFEEEGEFRIFSSELEEAVLNVSYRNDGLVRYAELPFGCEISSIVKHVVLGPCDLLSETALIKSVTMVLRKAGIDVPVVIPSRIPLKI